jgi:hypothetical protein
MKPPNFGAPSEDLERLRFVEVPEDVRKRSIEARIAEARSDPNYRHRIAYALTGREEMRANTAPRSSPRTEPATARPLEPATAPDRPLDVPGSGHDTSDRGSPDAEAAELRSRPERVAPAIARALVVGILLGGFAILVGILLARGASSTREPVQARVQPASNFEAATTRRMAATTRRPAESSPGSVPQRHDAAGPEGPDAAQPMPAADPRTRSTRATSAKGTAPKPRQLAASGVQPEPAVPTQLPTAAPARTEPVTVLRPRSSSGRFAPNDD